MPEIAAQQNSTVSKVETGNQDLFGERFREGRDLIDRQEWASGAEKFRETVEKYPDHRLADAALYWLAFCYKKQKKYKEADAALARLLEKFPSSAWAGDAQVMKTEIAPWIGRLGVLGNDNINSNVAPGQFSSDLQADIVKGTVNSSVQSPSLTEKLAITDRRLSLDRADEIKLAAFQSLLTADPKRAVETMGEVLTPDSKASETLKREILRVWRNPRLFASNTLVSNIDKNIGGKEFVSLLRETLAKSFQNEKNLKIRIEIIYTLASLDDGQSLAYLKQLYATENDRDIRKDIINSFAASAGESSKFNSDAFPGIVTGLNLSREQKRKIQIEFLLEIVRDEKDIELRRLAFANLRRFKGWTASEQAVDLMTRLYDSETDEEFKISIVRVLAEFKQNKATKKLVDIARKDKSDKLRLEVIYLLRDSKDPEAIKILEELIK
jgi:HEAT repeat protein